MKAVIGQFYKTSAKAIKRIEELKRMREGRVAFVAVGNEEKEFIVISETQARECGIKVPLTARRYGRLPKKLDKK